MFLFPFCLFPNMSMVSTLTKFFTPRIPPGSTYTAASPLPAALRAFTALSNCWTGPVASPSGESFFHLGWAAYCVTLCHLGAYDTCHLSASDLPHITATTFYSAITGSHAVQSVAFFPDEHFLKLHTSETAFLFLPGRCSSSLSIFTVNPLSSLHLQIPPDKCLTSYQLPYPPSTSSSHLNFYLVYCFSQFPNLSHTPFTQSSLYMQPRILLTISIRPMP